MLNIISVLSIAKYSKSSLSSIFGELLKRLEYNKSKENGQFKQQNSGLLTERSQTYSDSTIESLYGKDAQNWEKPYLFSNRQE